jgi:GNAT superfamily N-acetyltransferase
MIIRRAVPTDADDIARVHVRSWQDGYRGLLADAYLDGLQPRDRASRYVLDADDPTAPATIVAVDRGAICGFATTSPARDDDVVGLGELCALYVDPASWGTGVGRALIEEARAHLVEQGFVAAVLWVLVGNERAERFYARDGWEPDGSLRRNEVWGATADEHRYRRRLA